MVLLTPVHLHPQGARSTAGCRSYVTTVGGTHSHTPWSPCPPHALVSLRAKMYEFQGDHALAVPNQVASFPKDNELAPQRSWWLPGECGRGSDPLWVPTEILAREGTGSSASTGCLDRARIKGVSEETCPPFTFPIPLNNASKIGSCLVSSPIQFQRHYNPFI